MKNILTSVKKELYRFFSDRRLVATALLPGILIYMIYSLMGGAMTESFGEDEDTVYIVYVENLPDSMKAMCESTERFEFQEGFDTDKVTDGDGDLAVRFPADFEGAIAGYDSLSGNPAPRVEIYHDSTETESYNA